MFTKVFLIFVLIFFVGIKSHSIYIGHSIGRGRYHMEEIQILGSMFEGFDSPAIEEVDSGSRPLEHLNNNTIGKRYLEERKPISVDDKPVFLTTLPLVKLGDNYYYFSNETANFYQAFEFCKKNDMGLASIESETENEFIVKHLHQKAADTPGERDAWISGSDLANEGTFIWWSTGQPVTYTNWHMDEPNNCDNREHCIFINERWQNSGCTFRWNDVSCDTTRRFICETAPMYEFSLKKQDPTVQEQ